MDVHLRRRIAFATVLTLVGVPAYLALGRDASGSTAGTNVEAATGSAGSGSPEPSPESTAAFTVPVTEMPTPVFLDNTAVIVPPAVIDVVRPEPVNGNEVQGKASFIRYADWRGDRPCTTGLAREGVLVTVTNTANGLSTVCRNTLGLDLPADVTVLLDTDLYTTIADLADAPVFVRITW